MSITLDPEPIEVVDPDVYYMQEVCKFLDRVRDFTPPHKSKPNMARQPGGATQSKP